MLYLLLAVPTSCAYMHTRLIGCAESDALASRPTEVELSEVSKEVSSQYRKLLTHLGTPLSKVSSLRQNNLADVEEICFEGLVHWLGQNGEEPYSPATWAILLEAIDKGAERKDYAERLRQKLLGGGEVRIRPEPFGTAHLIPIRHPLESKFIRLFEAVRDLLETSKTPPLDDLKEFCKYLFCRDASTVEAVCCATNYREVVKILYSHSYWMGYNYMEMLIHHYKEPLKAIQALVDSYNAELASIVTTRLSEIKKISDPLPDQPRSKGKYLQKIVFRYNLDADGITLESLVQNVKFLSSRLHIQLELLDVLLGSVALVLSLPTERAVQVWSRVEDCWRELWKMRVVWIHLEGEHNRFMDLVQKKNEYIPYGTPETLQSVVIKRGEGIALSTGHQSVPKKSTQGQQSAYSSVLETSGTAEDLAKVKREYQFQVSHMIPWLSSVRADNADKLKQVLLALTVHSDDPGLLLFKDTDVKDVSGPILQYSAWYESDVLQQLLMECLARKADELKIFEQDRRSLLGHISVDKAFPSPLLSFPPLLGYSPMVVHLALSPTWVAMEQVWELKNTICSALHLQPYSLLLRGYSAGSTNLVFYLASSARVTTERVGVVMMSSDVIIHSMAFDCGTQHEVNYHLDQFLSESAPELSPQPKRRKVSSAIL